MKWVLRGFELWVCFLLPAPISRVHPLHCPLDPYFPCAGGAASSKRFSSGLFQGSLSTWPPLARAGRPPRCCLTVRDHRMQLPQISGTARILGFSLRSVVDVTQRR